MNEIGGKIDDKLIRPVFSEPSIDSEDTDDQPLIIQPVIKEQSGDEDEGNEATPLIFPIHNESRSDDKLIVNTDDPYVSLSEFNMNRIGGEAVMSQEMKITDLRPHPKNGMIYGQEEDVSDFVILIREAGKIIEPLKITSENVIISGHRRWMAAQELGLDTVPCEVVSFDSPEAELEALIVYNASRDKTVQQRTREGIAMEEVISAKSKKRRASKLKQNQTDMDSSSITDDMVTEEGNEVEEGLAGTTRDEIARVVGISSGRQFDRMKSVINMADKLKGEGKGTDSLLLTTILNKSPSAAYELSTKIDLNSLTSDDKNNLLSGKVPPRSFIPSISKDKSIAVSQSSYDSALAQLIKIDTAIKELNKITLTSGVERKDRKIYAKINTQIQNLQNLLPQNSNNYSD